jgi:hypothetical protein
MQLGVCTVSPLLYEASAVCSLRPLLYVASCVCSLRPQYLLGGPLLVFGSSQNRRHFLLYEDTYIAA